VPSEHLAVEIERLAVVAGGELMVDRRTVLVDDLEATVPGGLPETEEAAGRIGEQTHQALVLDLNRFGRLDTRRGAGTESRGQSGGHICGVQIGAATETHRARPSTRIALCL
jgi:hypothetical protein